MKERSGRLSLIVVALAAIACVFASVAVAATITGTNGRDRLNGSNDADTINGLAGGDRISARGGDDPRAFLNGSYTWQGQRSIDGQLAALYGLSGGKTVAVSTKSSPSASEVGVRSGAITFTSNRFAPS